MHVAPLYSGMQSYPESSALTKADATTSATTIASDTQVRIKRASPVVDLETKKAATALIRAGDAALSSLHSAALMDHVIADPTGRKSSRQTQVISDIPPFSTFGKAWARLTHAIQSDPFASFARKHKIDTSTLKLNTQSGWTFDCIANGKSATFNKYDTDYEQATAAVTAAAQAFASPPKKSINYTGAHRASAAVVGDFYAARHNGTQADILRLISLQQHHQSFDALREPDAKAPAFNPPAYSHIREQQREAIEDFAGEIALKPELLSPSQRTPKPSVEDADREMAKLYGSALLSLRPEMAPYGNGPRTTFAVSEIPEYSTLGQTLRNTQVPADKDAQISLARISEFYAEPDDKDTTWVGTLTNASRLTREGFRALNNANPPTDERYRAVQAKQRAAIQRLENPSATQPEVPAPPTDKPIAAIARRQFAGEPNVYSVVARLLSEQIKQAAPSLDVDVNQIAIETPDADNPGNVKRTPLMTLALDYLAGGEAPNFTSTDRAFDTRPDLLARTGNAADAPLALDLSALSAAISTLPARLNPAYDADSREYWNKPAFSTATNTDAAFSGSHRALVSRILRSNLQLASLKQPGLDDEQRKTVDMVVRHPEGSTRPAPLDPNSSGATVYTLAGDTPNKVIHRYLSQSNRDILLQVEPNGKITPYDSWDDLEKSGHTRQELTGNMFDTQADTLIKQHQGDSLFNRPAPLGTGNPTQATTKLPDWMNNANEAQRFVMHELSLGLASFIQRNKGSAYNSDIKDIRAFAQQQFDLLPEHQKLTQHAAENLEVVFKVPYGTLGSGFIDRQTMSLTDMLLNNLSGLPNGQIEVYFKSGLKDENGVAIKVRVPALEQEGVLKKLVTELDIGKTYPALLKEKLLDDPVKMAERRSLFVQQVPLELQLKALELSIKGEAGFNNTGLRYVQEILKPGPGPRTVDGKEIVIRPLAFDNKAQGQTDVVESAYLIEPKDSTTGPHILYRPLVADAPLRQFPSRQALLEAIQQPGKLQNDTLAWLPDENTRQLYRGNGFKHPNVVIFGHNLGSVSANEAIPLAVDTRLQQTLQEGKLMEYLYQANAQSLITLAGQQSTSDAQSRWASLKTGGFLLLNAVLPALRGPGAILGVLLQAEGIIKDLEILRDEDSKGKEAALTDLLVNLATLLVHFKARSLPETSTALSARPATGGGLLVDDLPSLTPPAEHPLQMGTEVAIQQTGNSTRVPRLRVMKGNMKEMRHVKGDLFTFVDEYKGKPRLNINAHGRDLSLLEKYTGSASTIIYDGAEHTAAQLHADLLAKGIDPSEFENTRLLVCYSGNGNENSLAADFQKLIKKPVKAFIGTVTITPTPELVDAEFNSYTQRYGPDKGPLLLSDTYAEYENVDMIKDRGDISILTNPLEYFTFTYFPVYHPARTGARQ